MTGEEAMKLNGIYYRIPALYDSGIVSLHGPPNGTTQTSDRCNNYLEEHTHRL